MATAAPPKNYLTPEDVDLLEQNAVTLDPPSGEMVPCLRDILLIRLLFRTGIRVGEALAIAVEDVDLERGEVKVVRLKERSRLYCPDCGARLGRAHLFCPGCGHQVTAAERRVQEERRQRLLPLDPETVGKLRYFIEAGGPRQVEDRLMLFKLKHSRAWQVINEAAVRAGLPDLINPETGRLRKISPHRLRDAFATHAAGRDSSPEAMKMLQEHLGHKSMDQTARYVKVASDSQRKWYERLWGDKGTGQGG